MNLIQSHRCWGEGGNDWVSSCLISSLLLQLSLNRVLFSKFLWITIYYCLRLVQKPEIRLGIAVNSLNVEAGKYRPTTKFERPWIRVLLSQDVNIEQEFSGDCFLSPENCVCEEYKSRRQNLLSTWRRKW